MAQLKEYALNAKQVRILKLLFKFRFATAEFLAIHLSLTSSTMNTNLSNLARRDLIDRHYSRIDRMDRKSARYYLSAIGLKNLKKFEKLNVGVLRNYYKNKNLSDGFIQHCLNVFRSSIELEKLYPAQFTMLTKADMANYDQFPKTKPDLFLQSSNMDKCYFLYLYEDSPLWIIQKQIRQLIQHEEGGAIGREVTQIF